jgi:hypothetical protein
MQTLPEVSLDNIAAILRSNNMSERIPENADLSDIFNCWGFTAYYCGWVDDVYWMENDDMEYFLSKNTIPVSEGEVRAGDIAVFRFNTSKILTHTAIILSNTGLILHKSGRDPLCVDFIQNSSFYGCVTYARVKKS